VILMLACTLPTLGQLALTAVRAFLYAAEELFETMLHRMP
jgi:hypothetical protein